MAPKQNTKKNNFNDNEREGKKKWFDIKFEAKRRISVQQRKKDTGGRQGSPALSTFDERMAAIIGQASLSGIIERSEGESDLIQEQLQHGNLLKSKSLF